jgi:hypothetical protein
MLASILIIAFSFVLFVYWFRATCQLLLRNHAEQTAATPATANDRFSFPQVQMMLKTEPELGSLHSLLNQDFRVLTYVRQHAASLESGSFEDRLLILDYRIMQWYFRFMNVVLPSQARTALSEMATVVGVLAHRMSPQTEI